MSEKMSREEFRDIAYGMSCLARLPNRPKTIGDLFELIAYAQGEYTRVVVDFANVCPDVSAKLGFGFHARQEVLRLYSEAKSYAPAKPGSSGQVVITQRLQDIHYHAAMFLWSIRSLVDALSVHLNG